MKTKQKYLKSSKKWKKENKDRINKTSKAWREKNKDRVESYRDNFYYGRNSQEILERDNFECTKCGMSQEQHILIFNTRLQMHHEDGKGRRNTNPNNDIGNIITVCIRCHAKIHREREMEKRWGDLLEQDNSEWAFPKLRELIEKEIKGGSGVQEAKRIVSKNTGLGFSTIDHRYYELKSNTRSAIQKRRQTKNDLLRSV